MVDEPTALLDACVLYPAPLRDFLMHLTLLDAFRARWTETIHDEWIRSVLAQRPDLTLEQLSRTKELMNTHTRDAVVEGYERLIDTVTLPDADDRHVLAAAIHTQADYIVTFNLRDFPGAELRPYDLEAIHPDAFILRLIEKDEDRVLLAAERHRNTLRNPPKSSLEYWATLESQGLRQTVVKLRETSK